MATSPGDNPLETAFVGSVPDLYDRLMVPMIFAEAAAAMAVEVASRDPGDILEVAAGTGVLTRSMARECPHARIVATDLNEPMLAVAARRQGPVEDGSPAVRWQQADAAHLPFDDNTFDVVVHQFGVMFFPDRTGAHAEARRVLRPDATLLFSTWDSLATNDFARIATDALVEVSSDDALRFMERTPHGYHDEDQIRTDLAAAGFTSVDITPVEGVGRSSAADVALAFCQGTPLRGILQSTGVLDLASATRLVETALAEALGPGMIEGRIRSLRVVAR